MEHIKTLMILFIVFSTCAGKIPAQSDHYTAEVTPFSSTQYDEYSPVFYRNGIVFCSNRFDNQFIKYMNKENKGHFNIYYINTKDSITWEDSRLFEGNLVTRYNDGPVTFNKKEQIIYFSRNIHIKDKKKNILDFLKFTNNLSNNTLGIFSAKRKDETWSNIQSFPYNSQEYHNTTPYYDTLNNRLFFASTMPGGYGGTDLYYSEKTDSSWSEPVNLGSTINTKGNEVYPFISPSGKLFFASDGHGGRGGKDIFFTEKKNGEWIEPIHLKTPINSKNDDFGLITDADFQSGYFSSNRKGSDDIYRFQTYMPQFYNCDSLKENHYCFRFWDEGYHKIDTLPTRYEWKFSDGTMAEGLEVEHCFPGAGQYRVKLNIMDDMADTVYYTKKDFEFEIKDSVQPYIRSRDAFIKNKKMEFDGLKSNLPDFQIEEYYWKFGDGSLGRGSKVHHTYEKKGNYKVVLGVTGINESTGVKKKHCVWKEVKIFKDYQALAMHQARKEKISVKDSSDNHSNYNEERARDFEQTQVKCYTIAEFPEEVLNRIKEAFSRVNSSQFGFNETEVAESSHSILDCIVKIMKANSSIKTKIAVHTDNTDSLESNKKLSEERAQSIVNYIVSKGIPKDRLRVVGYGESSPIASNQTKDEKKENRGVNFILMDQWL